MCLNPTLSFNPTWLRLCSPEGATINNAPYVGLVPLTHSFIRQCAESFGLSFDDKGSLVSEPSDVLRFLDSNFGIFGSSRIPVFVAFPCNRCILCLDSKRAEYERRLLFEASDYPNMAFFTLTYDNAHLPACGLYRKHVSSWLKLFRIRLERLAPFFNIDPSRLHFRCFYVGEYGTKRTCRAHYHGLIFFKNQLTPIENYFFSSVFWDRKTHTKDFGLSRCWQHGFMRSFSFVRNAEASSRYISKYILKQSHNYVPEDKNPHFVCGPSRGGGLGCSKLEAHVHNILNVPTPYCSVRIRNKCVNVFVPRNILSKLFPSPSRLLPYCSSVVKLLISLESRLTEDPLYSGRDADFFRSVIDSHKYLIKGSYNTPQFKFWLNLINNIASEQGFPFVFDSCMLLCSYLLDGCNSVDYPSFVEIIKSKLSYFERTRTDFDLDRVCELKYNCAVNYDIKAKQMAYKNHSYVTY